MSISVEVIEFRNPEQKCLSTHTHRENLLFYIPEIMFINYGLTFYLYFLLDNSKSE